MKLTHILPLVSLAPSTIIATWHLSLIHHNYATQTAAGLEDHPCTPIRHNTSLLLHLSFTGLEYSVSVSRPQLRNNPLLRPEVFLNGRRLAHDSSREGELVARVSKKAVLMLWRDGGCGKEGGEVIWEGEHAWMAMGLEEKDVEVTFGKGTEVGKEMWAGSFEVIMVERTARNMDRVVVEIVRK